MGLFKWQIIIFIHLCDIMIYLSIISIDCVKEPLCNPLMTYFYLIYEINLLKF